MGDFFAVDEYAEAGASVIALAGLVPEDGERASVIADVIQAEVIERTIGYEWVDFDQVIRARAEAAASEGHA